MTWSAAGSRQWHVDEMFAQTAVSSSSAATYRLASSQRTLARVEKAGAVAVEMSTKRSVKGTAAHVGCERSPVKRGAGAPSRCCATSWRGYDEENEQSKAAAPPALRPSARAAARGIVCGGGA